MEFEPKILGFLCNWCSYSAADSAGASHLAYPPNVKLIRVMCTGRVDPTLVLHAFSSGVDGVVVCGCHPGDCHYISGNCKAAGRFGLLKRILADFGIEEERFRLEWIGATQSERFAEVTTEMTEHVRALGPLAWPSLISEPASRGERP
ncbi:MAG: hydrogenase iron-sulfur subunit [Deltaproteobacteria bacterium]|nr:hydrogenase iron-sulfur subunit [Deltaproteobacteria bacterium]